MALNAVPGRLPVGNSHIEAGGHKRMIAEEGLSASVGVIGCVGGGTWMRGGAGGRLLATHSPHLPTPPPRVRAAVVSAQSTAAYTAAESAAQRHRRQAAVYAAPTTAVDARWWRWVPTMSTGCGWRRTWPSPTTPLRRAAPRRPPRPSAAADPTETRGGETCAQCSRGRSRRCSRRRGGPCRRCCAASSGRGCSSHSWARGAAICRCGGRRVVVAAAW